MSASLDRGEIFIVDDDDDMRDGYSSLFSQAGWRVESFASGAFFVAAGRIPTGVILDMFMPGRSGLEILADVDAHNYPAPIFMVSGHGDITDAVNAIKGGAFDYFEKPMDGRVLVERVSVEWERRRNRASKPHRLSFVGSELLSDREHEVLADIATGASNKDAARNLGISPRTIELHRANIMRKLCARNPIELGRKISGELRYS
jgi:two-component system response regulator FixJ